MKTIQPSVLTTRARCTGSRLPFAFVLRFIGGGYFQCANSRLPLRYTVLWVVLGVLVSCDATRQLGDKEKLYTGAEVTVEAEALSSSEKKELSVFSEALIRPRPNTRVLGIPYKLLVYQATRPGEDRVAQPSGVKKKDTTVQKIDSGVQTKDSLSSGVQDSLLSKVSVKYNLVESIKTWLRSNYGEAPVLYSRVDPAFTSRLIQNELDNKGYFRARVDFDTVQQNKNVKVHYRVMPGSLYRIGRVDFPDDESELAKAVAATQTTTLLKPEQAYSLELIKAERLRIDELLKERGFYYFSPDHLLVQADSSAGNHRVNLKLIVKPETPALAYEQYYVRNIIIDPPQDFRPGVLEDLLLFQRNSVYNRTNHNLALHRLVSMGNFQFVRNRFVKADTTGNYLDAIYTLTPFRSKSLRAELSARTNSADFSGTALTANWSHRNAFKGGELFTVSAFGSMDFQVGPGTGYSLYRTGTEASIVWPRLVAPFKAVPTGKFIPKTRAALGYELQHRSQLYTRHQFIASFGYQWKSSERASHRLMLTEISYANPAFISEEYKLLIQKDFGLIKSVERELISGPSYSFEYTNTLEQQRSHRFYAKSSVQTSAVVLGLLSGVSPQQSTPKTVLGVLFSQFVRLEQEYRHYYRVGPAVELVGRVIAGAGLPYGNSVAMPYARQFFIGGSNSLRAFPARSVGPGSYRSPVAGSGFMPDESGDLKLELNAEFRARLLGFLHGALFVDAGNVWLLNSSPLKPGGTFSGAFLNELAIGSGAGIRLDFSMIVLRLDLAIPLHKPWLPAGSRWVGSEADFGTAAWWKNNRMWNIGIGYPF